MNDVPYFARWKSYIHRLTRITAILALCLNCIIACTPGDPAFNAVRQAIQDEDKDPYATLKILEANLDKVKDKQVIEVLLNYLREQSQKQKYYAENISQALAFLQRISGIGSRVELTFLGPIYNNREDWSQDIAQWQDWWNANKDYIYWDEQAQALKVKPH